MLLSIGAALCMVFMTVAPASAERQITQQTTYVGPFSIPAGWRDDSNSTIKALLLNFYRPLALGNIGSPEGHQGKFQYLAFYFCGPLTPNVQQCYDNNDSIGNAVVMLRIKPLDAPAPSTTFDPSTVEFSDELVVWFPDTPEGSTSCVSMTPWGGLPFLALTRRGLTDLRPALAIDEETLQVVTTLTSASWIPDAPEGNFTWRCSRLQ